MGYNRVRDVSTRLLRPTLPAIDEDAILQAAANWKVEWEHDGSVAIFDEGIAQYMIADQKSHVLFYAALLLGKPSLRCRLVDDEPEDELEVKSANTFKLHEASRKLSDQERQQMAYLVDVLQRRGYRF